MIKAIGFEAGKEQIDEKSLDSYLRSLLQIKNLVVLTGAGSSILRNEDNEDIGGLSMATMVDQVKEYPDFVDAMSAATDVDAEVIAKINSSNNLEALLTELDSLVSARKIMDAIDHKQLFEIQSAILKYMHKVCIIDRTGKQFPHELFLKKLLVSRKLSSPRLKVFTLNYDTLFEQAAQDLEAIVVDGFSFSQPRKFQGGNFDLDIVRRNHNRLGKEENYYSNVLHVYKLHGSVDWKLNGERIEQVESSQVDSTKSVIIYPGSHKYQESYSMPFYELISRLQSSVREPNTSLLVIGYSFGDEHINRIILEAIGSNLSLSIYIVSPSAAGDSANNNSVVKKLQERVKNGELKNVFMLSERFNEFAMALPYFGGGSVELEQTNMNIDEELAITGDTVDEPPEPSL